MSADLCYADKCRILATVMSESAWLEWREWFREQAARDGVPAPLIAEIIADCEAARRLQ